MNDLDRTRSACEELYRYLRLISGGQPGGRFIEVRQATKPGGMTQHFIPVRQIGRAHQLIRTLAPTTDIYTGVLLRDRRAGGRDAVSTAHLVFVEIDAPDAERKLAGFHRPTVVIGSGTPGHVHAYWHLRQPVEVVELERANRRLAHRLGGDSASVDAARILRPPATLNHKHRPPAAVRVLDTHAAQRYELGDLIDGLPDPEGSPVRGLASHTRQRHHPIDQRLLAIAAAEYVGALTGQQPTRAGKIRCPFHDDRTPSLQLYEDRSWYCFGCRIGGTIYDFAAKLWLTGQSRGGKLRGRDFLRVRQRLAEIFLR
jgi:hypothetical protein